MKQTAKTIAEINLLLSDYNEAEEWAKRYGEDFPQEQEWVNEFLTKVFVNKLDFTHGDLNEIKMAIEGLFSTNENAKRNLLSILKMDTDNAWIALHYIPFKKIEGLDLRNDPEFVDLFNKLKNEGKRNVAIMYLAGIGTEKDLSKALEIYKDLYRNLSGLSRTITEYRLGELYEAGAEGGVPNFEKAQNHYYNCATYGYGPARSKYNALKSKEPQNVNDNIYAPKCYWKDGKLVNEQGKVIMSKGQYEIQSFQSEVIIVKKGNKVGALTYNGTLVVPVAYDKFEGTGAEARMLFSTTSGNSTTCSIFALNGRLVAKQTFSNSGSSYSVSMFIKNNMNFLNQPYR